MSNRYNGYTNYETWAINLWLSNDEGVYSLINDQIQEMLDNYDSDDKPEYWSVRDYFKYSLADWLKDWLEELREETIKDSFGVFNDLLTSAMDKVDWNELADCWLEEFYDEIDRLESESESD